MHRDGAPGRCRRARSARGGAQQSGGIFDAAGAGGSPPFYCRWFPPVFALKCCPGPCLIAPAAHHRYPSLKGERFHDKSPLGPLGHRF